MTRNSLGAGPVATIKSSAPMRLRSGPTTMYAQLGSILESKIMRGEWPEGFELPTLAEMCEQYDVARVTARQAIQMLAAKGLLVSQRGRRTQVVYTRPEGNTKPFFTSIGAINSSRADYSITLLSLETVMTLPEGAFQGISHGPYERIRKIHREGDVPYAYSENYVHHEIFARIPRKALTKTKLARLVRDHAEPPVARAAERLQVAAADYEEAQHLQYSMSGPVGCVDRIFIDSDDHILYYGRLIYRGDRFSVEHDITHYILSQPRP